MSEVLTPERKKELLSIHRWFDCGCCGMPFYGNLAIQLTFDQDDTYGICHSCEPININLGHAVKRERTREIMKSLLIEEKIKPNPDETTATE